ncbi:MAG: hypothetical protein KJ749_13360 [Planctomycetes bacterium]|nr:hypothetical protein [Planctomycetota bacterium]
MSKIRRGGTERGRYWQRWLGKWKRSGLTQAELCRRHGLKAENFAWWKRKLGEPVGSLGPIPWRPRGRRSMEFVELPSPMSSTAPSRCSAGYEVILRCGAVIRLPVDFDSDRVRQLISAAASAC